MSDKPFPAGRVPVIRDIVHLNDLLDNAASDRDLLAIRRQLEKQGLSTDFPAFEGLKRGGAAQTDDDTLTDEELRGIRQGWRALVEDRAHGGRLHYTMPPVRGMAPPGSFRIPRDVFAALGDGDLKVGGAVVHSMFGIEDDPDDPTLIHPHVLRIIGNGSLAAGRRVLERFVAQVRHGARAGVVLEHDGLQHEDGHHGWSVRR